MTSVGPPKIGVEPPEKVWPMSVVIQEDLDPATPVGLGPTREPAKKIMPSVRAILVDSEEGLPPTSPPSCPGI